jgi:rare lipoprotein A
VCNPTPDQLARRERLQKLLQSATEWIGLMARNARPGTGRGVAIRDMIALGVYLQPVLKCAAYALPAATLLMISSAALAATINPEASSPQRPSQPISRPAPASVSPVVRSTPAPSRPAAVARPALPTPPQAQKPASVATTAVRTPARAVGGPIAGPVRQVVVPVLGREGPAAKSVETNARQIAITASEPVLTSVVRPQDVASFQKIGAPYQVGGTWYVPAHEPDYDEVGVASWYGNEFHGRPTANGEIFDMNVVSGAHPTLPIPSLVEVTNLANGRSIVVRINDRGPFVGSRLIDMSSRGAELLGFRNQGHTNVRVRYVGPANMEAVVTAQNLTSPTAVAANAATKPIQVAAVTPLTAPSPATQQAFVQVGAFSQMANAERLREQASSLGPVQLVQVAQADGSPLYRVVLGPIANRAEATLKVQEMMTSGFTGARVMASLN